MTNFRRSKRPLTLLKIFGMMLDGKSDYNILGNGIKITDVMKARSFFEAISQNRNYISAAHENCIDIKLAKRMANAYTEHLEGKSILIFTKRTQAAYAFRLILSGHSDAEILEKRISEADINTAINFLEIAPHAEKMVLATMAKKVDVSRDLVCKMLKIYREMRPQIQLEMNENVIPVLA
jgi:hypothetical protein